MASKLIVIIEGARHEFTDDKKGNAAADALILAARKEYTANPWFTGLDKIANYRAKEYHYGKIMVSESEKAYQYRRKADKAESERNKFLKERPELRHPGALSVTIKREQTC